MAYKGKYDGLEIIRKLSVLVSRKMCKSPGFLVLLPTSRHLYHFVSPTKCTFVNIRSSSLHYSWVHRHTPAASMQVRVSVHREGDGEGSKKRCGIGSQPYEHQRSAYAAVCYFRTLS